MKVCVLLLVVTVLTVPHLWASHAEVLMGGPGMFFEDEAFDPNTPDPTVRLFEMIPPESRLELTCPSNIPRSKFSLLPAFHEQLDEDGFVYYTKAFEELSKLDMTPCRRWVKNAAKAVDQSPVPEMGTDCDQIAEWILKAARCRECTWPVQRVALERGTHRWWSRTYTLELKDPELYNKTVQDLRNLVPFCVVMIHREIENGDYEKAGRLLCAGFASVRQISSVHEPLFDLTAVDSISLYIREIEYWISRDGSPSLYEALRNLPRPLLQGLSNYIPEGEDHAADPMFDLDLFIMEMGTETEEPNEPTETSRQILPWPDNPRGLGLGFIPIQVDRWLTALETVEALRLWASWNEGRLPESLEQITELRVPVDPASRTQFYYQKVGTAAELVAPRTGNPVYDTEVLKYGIQIQ